MTPDALENLVVQALTSVAPEIDPARVRSSAGFRDDFDLDSMDFLNFVLALHARLGIDIPETDYSKLSTLAKTVAYLAARTGSATKRQ